jgi:hypothetical protein
MVLGQDRIMKTKWRVRNEEKTSVSPLKKSGVGQTIQTFFSDFFPTPSNPTVKK